MKKIHCLQHVAFEPAGRIAAWAESRGAAFEPVRLFAGDTLPPHDEVEALVVMGGPMGVHDEGRFAWMNDEKRLVEHALRAGKPVLGVCLGAQLVAHVLGARVYRNRFREIGWFRVEAAAAGRAHARFRLPDEFVPFHWHGDAFDLPAGAVHLARSVACAHQAFAWGDRALALQFHLEVTPEQIGEMIVRGREDIGTGPFVQPVEEMTAAPDRFEAAHALLDGLLDGWKEEPDERKS